MTVKAWELIGWAINDYYHGDKKATLITHNDCAGSEEMPVAVFFRTVRQLSDLERYALSICRGKTLDVGAGAGCHSLILKKKGIAVSALDISPLAVFTMTERGIENAICADIRDIYTHPGTASFDTVLMLMNGIGLVSNLEGLELFLTKIRPLLTPCGQLLFDSADLRLVKDGATGIVLDAKNSKDPAHYYGIVNYEVEYRGLRSEPFSWLYVDQRTLRKYATAAGWDCQIIYEEGYQYLARLIPL